MDISLDLKYIQLLTHTPSHGAQLSLKGNVTVLSSQEPCEIAL